MIHIEAWNSSHPDWNRLLDFIEAQQQSSWVNFQADWHQCSQILVALRDRRVVGFIRYVVQAIGSDEELPSVQFQGQPLLEAKILAFAVAAQERRQGIGRSLQQAVIESARREGLYQVRSHSSGKNKANHQLKLAMGFAVFPIERGDDREGAYFLLPLQTGSRGADYP